MAMFMLVLFGFLTLTLVISGISMLSDDETGIQMIMGGIICGFGVWLSIDGVDYKEGEPIPVNKDLISVMHDEKVAILRMDDEFTKTYDTKEQYDAILSDNYEMMKIVSYDMTGEENSYKYTLKLK